MLDAAIEQHIFELGYTDFYVGQYEAFDRMAQVALANVRKRLIAHVWQVASNSRDCLALAEKRGVIIKNLANHRMPIHIAVLRKHL